MKLSFRLFLAAGIAACLALSCSKYDDTELRSDISQLKDRVTELENWKNTAQGNIQSLLTLTQGLDKSWFISAVNELTDGYEIVFANGQKATIKNGTDGHSPAIGVKAASDGEYYWTLDGQWLYDADGNKLPVCGQDGKDGVDGHDGIDGENGENGKDGITPQLKIEDGYWYVSTDEGETWTKLGKATGESGAAGDAMFKEVTYDDNFVYFTLADGTELKISRGANGVQAIVAAPSFTDGSVAAVPGDFDITFKVIPASAAESLKVLDASCFDLEVVYTATKADVGDLIKLPIDHAHLYDGILVLSVDGSVLGPEFSSYLLGANGILTIDDGIKAVTSGYFSFCSMNKINGHDYVEMGDGLKWATCNLGATHPEEFGDYFAWAELTPKPSYNWSSYKYMTNGYADWQFVNKYQFADGQTVGVWYSSSSFVGDNFLSFDDCNYEDDAARQNWHGTWRTPTPDELYNLLDTANYEWEWQVDFKDSGVSGFLVTSKLPGYEGNCIFLPAAGYIEGKTVRGVGNNGCYWSNTVSNKYTDYAFYLDFYGSKSYYYLGDTGRDYGISIRPVSD